MSKGNTKSPFIAWIDKWPILTYGPSYGGEQYVAFVIFIADYEFQIGLLEAIFRLTSKSERPQYVKYWFNKQYLSDTFFTIRDAEFETVSKKDAGILQSVCSVPMLEIV